MESAELLGNDFFASTPGQAAIALLVIAFLELGLLVLADIRDARKNMRRIRKWLRETLAGSIAPLWLLLFVGFETSDVRVGDFNLLLVAAIGASALYIGSAVGAILDVWAPKQKKEDA